MWHTLPSSVISDPRLGASGRNWPSFGSRKKDIWIRFLKCKSVAFAEPRLMEQPQTYMSRVRRAGSLHYFPLRLSSSKICRVHSPLIASHMARIGNQPFAACASSFQPDFSRYHATANGFLSASADKSRCEHALLPPLLMFYGSVGGSQASIHYCFSREQIIQ